MEVKPRWEPGPGIRVVDAEFCGERWIVKAAASGDARCPSCSLQATRRHSFYMRRVQDLPVQGTVVELQVTMTRWRCCNQSCERRTFADQADRVIKPYARQTGRVAELAHLIGYAVGGRPAERLMRRLGMPQGDDRILRNLKRRGAVLPGQPLRVVGIDDWSWLKGARYGTIMVDLERREVVDVLQDRSARTTAAWLAKHPTVEIVSRDRCGLYAQAARQGAAQARQVADRFHLIQNLRQAIERQLSRDYRPPNLVQSKAVPQTAAATLGHDLLLDSAVEYSLSRSLPELLEHRQMVQDGRRGVWLERFEQVKELQRAGRKLNKIVEQTGLNSRTVSKWAASDVLPQRRQMEPRSTNPIRFESFLAQRWNEGSKNGRRLLTEVQLQGYTGSISHLQRLLSHWRRAGSAVLVQKPSIKDDPPATVPPRPIVSPIAASILCIKPRGQLTRQEVVKVDRLKATSQNFAIMRQLAMRFRGILRGNDPSKLEGWLDDAHYTGLYGIRRFVLYLRRDIEAVRNAISETWSNGQTEGQINRLKTLKRSMYGRAGTELLRARMLPLIH
jgi:transposase